MLVIVVIGDHHNAGTPLFQSMFRHSAGDTADTDRQCWRHYWYSLCLDYNPLSIQALVTALPLPVYIVVSALSLEDRPDQTYWIDIHSHMYIELSIRHQRIRTRLFRKGETRAPKGDAAAAAMAEPAGDGDDEVWVPYHFSTCGRRGHYSSTCRKPHN